MVSLVLMCACAFEGPPGPDGEEPGGDGNTGLGMNPGPDASIEQQCADAFGAAERYELCETPNDDCKFYVATNNSDCNALCASFSSTCVDSFDGDCASPSNNSGGCVATLGDQICVCALP